MNKKLFFSDQVLFYSSAAHAVASACEFVFKRDYHLNYDVSRLFIFYNGQILSEQNHRVHHDGVYPKHILQGMRKYGLCREEFWRYSRGLLNTEPSKEVYQRASYYTVVPLHLPCTIEAIETCLYHKIPVPINITIYEHAGTAIQANSGVLRPPNLNRVSAHGPQLHAVLLVGYDRDKQYFIARNSWGEEWVSIFIFFNFNS